MIHESAPSGESKYTKMTRSIWGVNPWDKQFTRPGETLPSVVKSALTELPGPESVYVLYPDNSLPEEERHQAPVADSGEVWGKGAWIVAEEEHAKKILADPRFSSAGTGNPLDYFGSFPWPAPTAVFATRMMVNLDNDEHKRKRRIVGGKLTPKFVKGLASTIKSHASEAFVKMNNSDDVLAAVGHVTTSTICDLMGIPTGDITLSNGETMMSREQIKIAIDTVAKQPSTPEASDAMLSLAVMAGQVAQYYTDNPTEAGDIVSKLISHQATEGGSGDKNLLSKEELEQYFMLLLIAGTETSRSASVIGMQKILEQCNEDEEFNEAVLYAFTHDDDKARLLQKNLINQTLAYVTPVRAVRRVARQTVVVDGVEYEKGDTVIISFAAINAQRPKGEDPRKININSEYEPFVFGWGPHHCIGSHLAKQEMLEIFKAFLPTLIEEGAVIDVTYSDSTFINSPHKATKQKN